MPPRVDQHSARSVRWAAKMHPDDAAAFRKLAADRGITTSDLLREPLLAVLEERTGYRVTRRSNAPYQPRSGEAGKVAKVIAVTLTPEEADIAAGLLDGATPPRGCTTSRRMSCGKRGTSPPPRLPASPARRPRGTRTCPRSTRPRSPRTARRPPGKRRKRATPSLRSARYWASRGRLCRC
jgi:hypothetical protein